MFKTKTKPITYQLDHILRDPEAASPDNAIFSGKSLLQEQTSPWALIHTEPDFPEVFEFHPADLPEK